MAGWLQPTPDMLLNLGIAGITNSWKHFRQVRVGVRSDRRSIVRLAGRRQPFVPFLRTFPMKLTNPSHILRKFLPPQQLYPKRSNCRRHLSISSIANRVPRATDVSFDQKADSRHFFARSRQRLTSVWIAETVSNLFGSIQNRSCRRSRGLA